MRLIDADKLFEKRWNADTRAGFVTVVDSGDILNDPTIDAVPVVRCKDCKFRSFGAFRKSINGDEEYLCNVWDTGGVNEDDFCGYGVRKEEAE